MEKLIRTAHPPDEDAVRAWAEQFLIDCIPLKARISRTQCDINRIRSRHNTDGTLARCNHNCPRFGAPPVVERKVCHAYKLQTSPFFKLCFCEGPDHYMYKREMESAPAWRKRKYGTPQCRRAALLHRGRP